MRYFAFRISLSELVNVNAHTNSVRADILL